MDNRLKNIIYSAILLLAMYLVWQYRKNQVPEPIMISGKTMGTTYHITYFDDQKRDFKAQVDSLLLVVNKSINTYDPTAEVSQFNKSTRGVALNLPYLLPPIEKAKEVFEITKGAFDPTVMPLVNAWGFGPGKRLKMDSTRIDSIRSFVGLSKVVLTNDSITKTDPRVQLDFGGIGQGYGADVITDFLRSKNITNMLVELGGEGLAVGINLKSRKPWEIGILDPASTPENQFFRAYVSLSNSSFTTSGNYFNYHVENGIKYSHTIDPHTGYPAKRALLSASVFSQDCTTADAWGTALMVMGHDHAIELLKQYKGIEAFLIYSTGDGTTETFVTPGIQPYLRIESGKP